jgi:stage II sporulation protein R
VIIGLLVYQKEEEIIIPSDAIRMRIIANSNNIKDLYEKKKLKEEIENDLYNMVKDLKSTNEARETIKNKIDIINEMISNKTKDFTLHYGMNYFPKKTYRGVVYKDGEYESLVLTLGDGLGDNWWCVLFPPLCLVEAEEHTDVEYKFFVKEIIDKYM